MCSDELQMCRPSPKGLGTNLCSLVDKYLLLPFFQHIQIDEVGLGKFLYKWSALVLSL